MIEIYLFTPSSTMSPVVYVVAALYAPELVVSFSVALALASISAVR